MQMKELHAPETRMHSAEVYTNEGMWKWGERLREGQFEVSKLDLTMQ